VQKNKRGMSALIIDAICYARSPQTMATNSM
jgi:hypothetical protein